MPAVQNSYSERMTVGRVGQVVNTEASVQVSRNVEGAAIAFGIPVAQGANDSGIRATASGDAAILGITARQRSTFEDAFPVNDSARVMTKGVIWVEAGVAVSAGDPVHVGAASGAFSNTGGIEVPHSRYDSSGAAGDLVKVRLG